MLGESAFNEKKWLKTITKFYKQRNYEKATIQSTISHWQVIAGVDCYVVMLYKALVENAFLS